MYCKKCGIQIENGMNFCPNCGSEIGSNSQQTQSQQDKHQQPPFQQNSYQYGEYQQPPFQQNPYQYGGYQQPPFQQNPYQYGGYQQPPFQQNPYQYGGYQQPPFQPGYYGAYPYFQKPLIEQLRTRLQIESIIWGIIAALQIISGLIFLALGSEDEEFIFLAVPLILCAICNTAFCINNSNYRNEIRKNPVGIVEEYTPIGSSIACLIYNILLGGIIGVAGAIYAFFVRSFVLKNAWEFKMIEAQFQSSCKNTHNQNNAYDSAYANTSNSERYITIYTINDGKVNTKRAAYSSLPKQYISHIENNNIYLHKKIADGEEKFFFISEKNFNSLTSNPQDNLQQSI